MDRIYDDSIPNSFGEAFDQYLQLPHAAAGPSGSEASNLQSSNILETSTQAGGQQQQHRSDFPDWPDLLETAGQAMDDHLKYQNDVMDTVQDLFDFGDLPALPQISQNFGFDQWVLHNPGVLDANSGNAAPIVNAPDAAPVSLRELQASPALQRAAPSFSSIDWGGMGAYNPGNFNAVAPGQDLKAANDPAESDAEDGDESDDENVAETADPGSKAKSKAFRRQCDGKATCTRSGKYVAGMYDGKKMCLRCGEAWEVKRARPPQWFINPAMSTDEALTVIRRPVIPPKRYRETAHLDQTLAHHRHNSQWWTRQFHLAAMTPHTDDGDSDHHLLAKHQDTLNANAIRRRRNKGYDQTTINARFALLFHIALSFHEGGQAFYGEGGDNFGYTANKRHNFLERLQKIESILKSNKGIVMDVIEGRGVEAFVRGPEEYDKRKKTNKQGNMARTNNKRGGRDGDGDDTPGGEGDSAAEGENSKPKKQTGKRKRTGKTNEGQVPTFPVKKQTAPRKKKTAAKPSPSTESADAGPSYGQIYQDGTFTPAPLQQPTPHLDPHLQGGGGFPAPSIQHPHMALPSTEGPQHGLPANHTPGGLPLNSYLQLPEKYEQTQQHSTQQQAQSAPRRVDGRHFYGPPPKSVDTAMPNASPWEQYRARSGDMKRMTRAQKDILQRTQRRWAAARDAGMTNEGYEDLLMRSGLPVPGQQDPSRQQ